MLWNHPALVTFIWSHEEKPGEFAVKHRMRQILLAGTVAVAMVGSVVSTSAQAATGSQAVVDHAVGTLQDLRGDKEFGNAKSLLHQAKAILIAPRIFKAGFFFGGEGGEAVLLVRGDHGWSNPAFYTVASASFGLQIGAQESEMIMFVMTDKALQALMKDNFKIGANAGVAVATLGSTVEAATTSHAGPDLIVWASSSGAYAGISLDGTLVEPQHSDDAQYYGRKVSSGDVVLRRQVHNRAADSLLQTLNGL